MTKNRKASVRFDGSHGSLGHQPTAPETDDLCNRRDRRGHSVTIVLSKRPAVWKRIVFPLPCIAMSNRGRRVALAGLVIASGMLSLWAGACTDDEGQGREDAGISFDGTFPDSSRVGDGSDVEVAADSDADSNELDAGADVGDGALGIDACVPSLADVGTGDFEIEFDVTTNALGSPFSLIEQRSSCSGPCAGGVNFWQLRLQADAAISTELCGGGYELWSSTVGLAIGSGHHVVVYRRGGVLGITVDGADGGTRESDVALNRLQNSALCQATNCACERAGDGTRALDGSVSNICLKKL